MFLAIDIGNTNITLGVYEGERLRATWRVATVHDRMPDEYGILSSQLLEHRACRRRGSRGGDRQRRAQPDRHFSSG